MLNNRSWKRSQGEGKSVGKGKERRKRKRKTGQEEVRFTGGENIESTSNFSPSTRDFKLFDQIDHMLIIKHHLTIIIYYINIK